MVMWTIGATLSWTTTFWWLWLKAIWSQEKWNVRLCSHIGSWRAGFWFIAHVRLLFGSLHHCLNVAKWDSGVNWLWSWTDPHAHENNNKDVRSSTLSNRCKHGSHWSQHVQSLYAEQVRGAASRWRAKFFDSVFLLSIGCFSYTELCLCVAAELEPGWGLLWHNWLHESRLDPEVHVCIHRTTPASDTEVASVPIWLFRPEKWQARSVRWVSRWTGVQTNENHPPCVTSAVWLTAGEAAFCRGHWVAACLFSNFFSFASFSFVALLWDQLSTDHSPIPRVDRNMFLHTCFLLPSTIKW